MNKITIARKPCLTVILILAVLALVFAVSIPNDQIAQASTESRVTQNDSQYNILEFDISTGTYVPGTCMRVLNNMYPTITLTLKGSQRSSSVVYQYVQKETIVSEDDMESLSWITLSPSQDWWKADLALENIVGGGFRGIFSAYFYFRIVINIEGIDFYYISPSFVDVLLDCSGSSTQYGISTLSASYMYNNVETQYNTDSSEPKWVASPITFRATGLDPTKNDTRFFYSIDNGLTKRPFDIKSKTEQGRLEYYGEAILDESYAGEVLVYATDISLTEEHTFLGGRKYVRLDTVIPEFTVTATTIDRTNPLLPVIAYDNNKWANSEVIYTLARKPGSIGLSGLTFMVKDINKSNNWVPVNREPNGSFVYIVQKTTRNLSFKAVNDAGKEYNSNINYATYISTTVPKLNIVAVDSLNTTITTMGTMPSVNYRVGYAADSINFSITNDNPELKVGADPVASVKVQYAIREKDTNGNTTTTQYYEINEISKKYSLNYTIGGNNLPIKERTYIFRIISEAGYYDIQEFTVSVLKSNYSFSMEPLNVTTNSAGWVVFPGTTEAEIEAAAKKGVPVYLYVENFLGTADEFDFYSQIYGDNTTEKRITDVVKDTTYNGANGISRYIVYIKQMLDRKSMSFFVVNKAEARSAVLTTQELRLDAAKPYGNVSRKIGGTLELYQDEWAASSVQIQITPKAAIIGDSTVSSNISGVFCYPLVGDGTVLGRQISLTNGYFAQTVSETGIYSFRLISGAGVFTDVHVDVKIDTTVFGQNMIGNTKMPWITVETSDGNPVDIVSPTTDRYELAKKTAQPLRILFNTTHGDHITYEWAEMVNNVPPQAGDFTRIPNPEDKEQAFIFTLSTGATGTVTYVFNLYSKAKNKDGIFQSRMGIVLTISYDNATFSITATTDQLPDRWTKDDIEFTLAIPENVTVSKYQIMLGNEANRVWRDITVINGVYTFSGIERFITTGVSADFTEEVKHRSYGYSYSGEIWFRAISDAGKASQECYVGNYMIDRIDRIDTANESIYGMHPLYAFYQQTGDYMIGSDGFYRLYSNSSIKIEPALMSTNVNVKELFEQKSAVQYYYVASDSASTIAPSIESASLVSSSTELNTGWYWVFAHNTVFNTKVSNKFYIAKENSKVNDPGILTAQFDTFAGVGAIDNTSPEGYFVFSWNNTATVLITVDSNSPVYYWYKIGASGAWTKYNPTAGPEVAEGTKEITFVGEETAKTDDYINRTDVIKAGNLNSTVQFRVTNLAGNVVYIDRSVVVRIEDSEPSFDVILITTDLNGDSRMVDPNDASDNGLGKWYPNSMQIIIVPTAVNPGGVTYTYDKLKDNSTGEGNPQKLPGNGTNFTTDDLSLFQDKNGYVNGKLSFVIVATSTAIGTTYPFPITIKIDKTMPEFSLRGRVSINGVERNIASGEWTNSTSGITIYRDVSPAVKESMDNASGVTYRYRRNGSVLNTWDSTSLTENSISSYTFIATTGAGRTYERNFEVKIDTLPPVIYSGYIEQNLDRIETYYIDQAITYEEDNLKYAKYNEYPLTNGQVIATNTVDPTNGGYVHIIIEDLAGNKTELKFYMTVFPLNVNTVTLSEADRRMVQNYESTFVKAKSSLHSSRQEYFEAYIARLWDRIATLEKMRDNYRAYLQTINSRVAFNLQDDYPEMYTYINYFITDDVTILYPQWLQDEIRWGVYDTYYLKLETEFAKLRALMVNVEAIQEDVTKLPATNVVKKSHYQSILRVYNAYESLSTDQKSVFKDTLYNKLLELKRKCEVLLLQDDSTGISIDGPDLAAGVAIEVVSYAKSSELFNNAQLVLLETMGDDEAIVSISKLALSGYGSQQNTGTILINLPIPDDYYDYIYFSVYRLSADGTLTPIQDTTISGDGRSVYFNDTQLDTYVLATRGNITVRPPSEKIYGKVGNIEIDGTLLSYITYVAVGMFAVLLIIMIIMGVKRKGFFRRYNKAYKNSLRAKGIENIPKGNMPAPTYPYDPTSKYDIGNKIYDKNK